MIRRTLIALSLVAAGFMAPTPAVAATSPWTDGQGLHVVSATKDGARTWRLVVSTSALSRPVRVNVLLPTGYDASSRRYPVLYLFHGTSGGADDWIAQGEAVQATASYPMVVVMPDMGLDGNGGSFFTDWVDQGTPLGAAKWETFHIDQLVPYVDAHVRTTGNRSGRAIAGLSQGGFGALSYAGRHADQFVSAASFSGAADIFRAPHARALGTALAASIMTGLNQVQPFAPFGDPATHELTWAGHNPAHLVDNMRATDLGLWSGNGVPGPYDVGVREPQDGEVGGQVAGVPIEAAADQSTASFVSYARAAGLYPYVNRYGPGTHTWPYWARDLREYLPRLQRVFDQRRPVPTTITHRATEQSWTQFGWRVDNLGAPAWTALVRASCTGFTFTGDRAEVTTPRSYTPGASYVVRWSGGTGPTKVRADRLGRLVLGVTTAGGSATAKITAAGAGASGSSR